MLGIQAPPSRRTSKVAPPSFELKVKVAPVWFVIGGRVRVDRGLRACAVDGDRLDVAGRVEGVVGGDDLERPGAVRRDRAGDRVGDGRVDADRGLRAAGRCRALEELDLVQVGVGAGGGDREGIRGGGVDDPDRSGDVDRGRVVVDAAILDDGRGGGVAGVVDCDHAQVVEPVGAAGRVPAGGLVRPGVRVRRRELVGDRGDARAAVARRRGERDGAGEIGSRVAHRRRRRCVVDADGDRRRGEGVAGVVGRQDAEVVLAVGLRRRVPARGLVRPGARADRRALELDGRDSRSTRIGGVARQADRAADVGASAGAVIEPVGFVLSTRTVIVAEAWALPALSVVTTRRSYWPSACGWCSSSRPGSSRCRRRSASAGTGRCATPEPPASAELLVRRDRAADVGSVGGSGDGAGRIGVVDANRDRSRGGGVAGEVGGDDAEVVLAVGLQGGVPARGLVRPGAGARGGALELDGVDARAAHVGGVAREHDGAANVGCGDRVRDGARRVRVVDENGDRRRGEGVAGVVGRDDAEVVLAVGLQGRVPARRPGSSRCRRLRGSAGR